MAEATLEQTAEQKAEAAALAADGGVYVKEGATEVKYSKDGADKKEDVPYTAKLAAGLSGAVDLATEQVGKIGEDYKRINGVTEKITADNLQDLCVDFIVAKFNAVMEANARQNARNAFLTNIAGPDKAIQAMAKKLAAIKKISEAEAEKQIRASFGF